jgi:hypothetical protein
MSPRARRSTLLSLAAALAATSLVAAGLPRLRLSPGLPLPAVNEGGILLSGPGLPAPAQVPVSKAVVLVLAVGGALLVLYALWRLLRGVRPSSLVPMVLRGLLLIAAVCAAVLVLTLFTPPGFVAAPVPPLPPPALAPRAPLGDPPPLLLWLTAGGLVLASGLTAAWLLRPRPPQRDPLLLVGLEAERARAALLAGGDARSVILACYARMSAVLAEERRIERPGSMTAREFGDLLGSLGVPRPPVQELTRLFEAVRYGRQRPSGADVDRALACLDPIVEHCRSARAEPRP